MGYDYVTISTQLDASTTKELELLFELWADDVLMRGMIERRLADRLHTCAQCGIQHQSQTYEETPRGWTWVPPLPEETEMHFFCVLCSRDHFHALVPEK